MYTVYIIGCLKKLAEKYGKKLNTFLLKWKLIFLNDTECNSLPIIYSVEILGFLSEQVFQLILYN